MNNSNRRILFFAEWSKIIKEYDPLVDDLKRHGFTPVVLTAAACPPHWIKSMQDRGIAFRIWEHYLGKKKEHPSPLQPLKELGHQNSIKRAPVKTSRWRVELSQLAVFVRTLVQYVGMRNVYGRIIKDVDPALIILPGEGNLRRMVPLKICREHQIPSLILPIFYPSRDSIWEANLRPECGDRYTNKSYMGALIQRIHPCSAYVRDNRAVLKDPAGEMLATWMLGLLPHHPWAVGTGLASRVAVQSQYEKKRIVECGGIADKLVVTGKPREDVVFRSMQLSEQTRRQLGIIPGRKVIVCSLPHYAEHGMLPWDEHWKQIQFLLESLDSLENAQVFLSIYPDSNEEQYREFLKPYKAQLPKIHDVFTLMGICDIYITNTTCSTISSAIGAYKPVVAFDFINNIKPTYAGVHSGVRYVYDGKGFLPAVRDLINNAQAYNTAIEEQKQAALELGVLDGQSTRRIIDEIKDLMMKES